MKLFVLVHMNILVINCLEFLLISSYCLVFIVCRGWINCRQPEERFVCVCECVCALVRACVRVSAYVCVCAYVSVCEAEILVR